MAELTTTDKLSLIATWRKDEQLGVTVYGALVLAGLVVTLFGSRLAHLTDLKQPELIQLLLGGTALPGAAAQLWKRLRAFRSLTFLSRAYTQNVAMPYAETVFARRLKESENSA